MSSETNFIRNSDYPEEQIEHKINEYRTLTNRLRRYWKRLMKESLQIAKERGLEIYATEHEIYPIYDIVIKKRGDEILDDSELLQLSKTKYSSLHRRYFQGLKKHKNLTEELEKIHDSI